MTETWLTEGWIDRQTDAFYTCGKVAAGVELSNGAL